MNLGAPTVALERPTIVSIQVITEGEVVLVTVEAGKRQSQAWLYGSLAASYDPYK